MWPFKKKEVVEPEISLTQICIDELKEFRDIGEKFNYMGVTIIVTGHYRLIGSGPFVSTSPSLSGDYKNDKGEIKAISFGYTELGALKAENT